MGEEKPILQGRYQGIFALLTDVFFLLHEHIEIMQIIINCHVMNSQAKKNEGDMI